MAEKGSHLLWRRKVFILVKKEDCVFCRFVFAYLFTHFKWRLAYTAQRHQVPKKSTLLVNQI